MLDSRCALNLTVELGLCRRLIMKYQQLVPLLNDPVMRGAAVVLMPEVFSTCLLAELQIQAQFSCRVEAVIKAENSHLVFLLDEKMRF